MVGLMNWLRKIFGASGQQHTMEDAANAASLLPVGAVLVDVRSQSEFDSGHIEGAVSLPLDRIHLGITRAVPEKATPVLLYCRSGARCGRARTILSGMGYTQVKNGGGIGSVASRLNRTVTSRR